MRWPNRDGSVKESYLNLGSYWRIPNRETRLWAGIELRMGVGANVVLAILVAKITPRDLQSSTLWNPI
jgi:hypothetical protein